MRTIKKILAALAVLIILLPCSAFAVPDSVSSVELIEKSKEYSDKMVTFVGEAIGDVMIRGDHAWINVNDGSNAIGIWLTAEQAAKIKNIGSYDLKGDEVRIVGRFYRACKEHGGDMDLHASTIEVIKEGYRLHQQPTNVLKVSLAFILFTAAIAFTIVIIKRRV